MTPGAIITALRALGVILEVDGDRIAIQRPARPPIPPELIEEARARRTQILAILSAPEVVAAQQILDAELIEVLTRADGERQWRARRTSAARSHLFLWPDSLPDLGPGMVGPFTSCLDCGTGTWATYGARALCLRCARARLGVSSE
jgi:hypothetical protein